MGCPSCGSDRLKAAPLPIISLLAAPVVPRRRYRCADCRWTGWKHRLRRRSDATASASLQQRETPDAPALWFFVLVLAFMAIVTVMLMRSCGGEPDPSTPVAQSLRDRADGPLAPGAAAQGSEKKETGTITVPVSTYGATSRSARSTS